jgi:hypothetical protein
MVDSSHVRVANYRKSAEFRGTDAIAPVQASVSALPEWTIDRECQQDRQVLEDAIANHDRFIARVDPDVNV